MAVLVYVIGFDAVEQSTREEHRGSLPFQRAVDPRPALPLSGGLVEDGQGWLLGDAIVTLTSLDDKRPLITAISDSSGWWSTEVKPGRYRLSVFLADYLPASEDIQLPASEKLVTRLVRGGIAVRGSVVDATGQPLLGARVVIHDGDRIAGTALTRRDGSFVGTIASSYTRISARADGHLDGEVARGETIVRLVPGVSLQGVVTNVYDETCPEADVEISYSLDGVYTHSMTLRTDDYGRFETLVPTGEISITARGPGCAVSIPVRLEVSGPRSVQIIADAGHQISGRVVLRGTGTAVRGATVSLRADDRTVEVATDADGVFVFQGVPAAPISLSVSHREHVVESEQTFAVTADRDVVVELDPKAPIRGRVEPPGVASLALEFELVLERVDWGGPVSYVPVKRMVVTTAPDGTFTLYGAPADLPLSLTATTADGLRGKLLLAAGGDRSNVRVVLAGSSNSLAGRVIDDLGAPVAGVEFEGSQADHVRTFVTDADGRFRLEHLQSSSIQISVGMRELGAIELAEGETTATITMPRKLGAIRGRVVEGGIPAADVWVSASPRDRFDLPVRTRTRVDGSFELTGLLAGPYTLSLPNDSPLSGTLEAETGATVTLAATRRSLLVVRATRNGKPVREYELRCRARGDDGYAVTVRSADGVHRSHLLRGEVTCLANAGLFGALAVGEGEVDLAFEPLAVVTGTAAPKADITYHHGPETYAPDLTPCSSTEADETGHFQIGIYPGPGTVVLRGDDFGIVAKRSVTGTRGGRVDLGLLSPE